MEKYFQVVKRSASQMHSQPKGSEAGKDSGEGQSLEKQSRSKLKTTHVHSRSNLNKMLLSTLGDESNPITHSDLADRSDKILSTSTGHQVTEDTMSRKRYFQERQSALSVQHRVAASTSASASTPRTGIFGNVRVYINGYLEGTTDIEIKRLVIEGGGKVQFTPSRCTHIITSQGLSGSKTQKHIQSLGSRKPHIVKPEWVLDSIASGRKRSERQYIVKMNQTLQDFMTQVTKP